MLNSFAVEVAPRISDSGIVERLRDRRGVRAKGVRLEASTIKKNWRWENIWQGRRRSYTSADVRWYHERIDNLWITMLGGFLGVMAFNGLIWKTRSETDE